MKVIRYTNLARKALALGPAFIPRGQEVQIQCLEEIEAVSTEVWEAIVPVKTLVKRDARVARKFQRNREIAALALLIFSLKELEPGLFRLFKPALRRKFREFKLDRKGNGLVVWHRPSQMPLN